MKNIVLVTIFIQNSGEKTTMKKWCEILSQWKHKGRVGNAVEMKAIN